MRINQSRIQHFLELMEVQDETRHKQKETELPFNQKNNEILQLFSGLDRATRREIMEIWLKYKLPLEHSSLKKLISFIHNTGGKTKQTTVRIKAFAFLLKNKLPLLPILINGVARCLEPEQSLATDLGKAVPLLTDSATSSNRDIPTAPQNELPSGLPANDKNAVDNKNIAGGKIEQAENKIKTNITFSAGLKKLIINPALPDLDKIIMRYPAILSELIQTLEENEGQDSLKILNRLLGQQLINVQDRGLMLALELPLFLPESKKMVPAFLQVWKDGSEKRDQKENSSRNYRISFFISLPKRGAIRADLIYKLDKIHSSFQSNSTETVKLIKQNIPALQKRFESLGLTMEQPVVSYLKCDETEMQENYLEPLLGFEKGSEDGLTHFDLRV